MTRPIGLTRREVEFFVDALERDGAPEWMELAAELREQWGMAPWPAGSVRQEDSVTESDHG